MFLRIKGQSTAEYAIIIGLVVAVAAGVLQVALKGGIRQKNQQAISYMLGAGTDNDEFVAAATAGRTANMYGQDYRKTTIDAAAFKDESVMKKGGMEEKVQVQKSTTESVNIETIDANNPTP